MPGFAQLRFLNFTSKVCLKTYEMLDSSIYSKIDLNNPLMASVAESLKFASLLIHLKRKSVS